MSNFSLSDIDRLHSVDTTGAGADQNACKTTNDSVAIEGVLSSDGLTLSLRSHNSGCTLLKRFCVRFNDTELRIIIYPLGDGHEFYDVLVGETSEGLKLVIESHRCYTSDMQANASALKRFHRHAFICSELSHANVVPFLGVLSSNQFPYACVFESTGKENLPRYLVSSPLTSRLRLLLEVARGLHYIHTLDVIHGSIRGTNIRIDDQGTVRIAGFAAATLVLEPENASEDVDEPAQFNAFRWCSPEILRPDAFGLTKAKLTKASDMYAFGMLAYEIYSGQFPFHDKKDIAAVVAAITSDERPSRPDHPQLIAKIYLYKRQMTTKLPFDWSPEP